MLIEYFRTLNFLIGLKQIIKDINTEDHFQKIRKIVEKYQIIQTTLEVNYSFLREIILEIRKLKKIILENIRELIHLNKEITNEELMTFIEKSKYFPIILTLALHYLRVYPIGLDLLRKIVSLIIKGDYFDRRYDLNNEITKEQLNPLLKGKNPEEYEQIIKRWRNYYFTFKVLIKETSKEIEYQELDWDQVLRYL